MNTATLRRPNRRVKTRRPRKLVKVRLGKHRHVMRNAEERNAYPKRPDEKTHPFETTMDF